MTSFPSAVVTAKGLRELGNKLNDIFTKNSISCEFQRNQAFQIFDIVTGLTWGQIKQWNYQMQDISFLLTSSRDMTRCV